MEITLEKIELVKDRTGVSYKEAKEALEAADGSVVDAIIAIEETVNIKSGSKAGDFADETVEKALHVVTKLRKLSVTSISRSDLYQKCRGRFFRDAKEMEPALNLLEQHGYIWLDVPAYSGVGRPSVGTIYVNPAALKDDFSA